MRGLIVLACLAGCRYDLDTGRFRVQWVLEGVECAGEPEPLVRIRSAAQSTVADVDDEYFDWFPCSPPEGFVETLTAPLPLGSYDVTAEIYTSRDGAVIGRSGQQPGALMTEDIVVDVSLVINPATTP